MKEKIETVVPHIKFRIGGQVCIPQSLTAYSLNRYGQVQKTTHRTIYYLKTKKGKRNNKQPKYKTAH